jgi:outer membrane lipoprotein SlyB
MKKALLLITLIAIAMTMAGCAALGPNTYSTGEQMGASNVTPATVVAVRPVRIAGKHRGAMSSGSLIGGLAGAIAGSTVGGGRGKYLTTALGTVVGSAAGQATQTHLEAGNGYQIVVRTEHGKSVAVVQRAQVAFHAGEPVWLVHSTRGRDRVEPRQGGVNGHQ